MALPARRTDDDNTAVTRWDPFEEIDRLNRQLSHLLASWGRLPNLLPDSFTPLADIEETTDAYLVEVELPGVKREDIDIEIAGRRLTVRGERKEKERVGILRRRERTVGRFHYEVTLPGDVEEGAVEAHLDEGVLVVRLPKPERARPRRIQVQ